MDGSLYGIYANPDHAVPNSIDYYSVFTLNLIQLRCTISFEKQKFSREQSAENAKKTKKKNFSKMEFEPKEIDFRPQFFYTRNPVNEIKTRDKQSRFCVCNVLKNIIFACENCFIQCRNGLTFTNREITCFLLGGEEKEVKNEFRVNGIQRNSLVRAILCNQI